LCNVLLFFLLCAPPRPSGTGGGGGGGGGVLQNSLQQDSTRVRVEANYRQKQSHTEMLGYMFDLTLQVDLTTQTEQFQCRLG